MKAIWDLSWVCAVGTVCLVLSVGGCNDEHNEGLFTAPAVLDGDRTSADGKAIYTDYFDVEAASASSARPLHMLWSIDNSPSMQDENSKIQAGIREFMGALKQYTDTVKVTMISKRLGGLQWDAKLLSDVGIHFIDFNSRSAHQLYTMARYLTCMEATSCRGGEKNASRQKYDGMFGGILDILLDTSRKILSLESFAANPLPGFFVDERAVKVLVVVTDDGEAVVAKKGKQQEVRDFLKGKLLQNHDEVKTAGVDDQAWSRLMREASDGFLDVLNDRYKNDLSSFRFFGFLDLKNKEKNDPQYSPNTQSYKALKNRFGGDLWHIKDLDKGKWLQVLAEAQKQLEELTKPQVCSQSCKLEHAVEEVQLVTVNDEELEKDEYEVDKQARLVKIKRELKSGDRVKIRYKSTS